MCNQNIQENKPRLQKTEKGAGGRRIIHKSPKSVFCVTCSRRSASTGAGVPGAVPRVSGEAAGGFCTAEEGSGSRFGETHSPQGARQDAAHLRQGHARRDRYL